MRFGTLGRAKKGARIVIAAALVMPFVITAVIGVEALMRARLDPQHTAAPTRFYARPHVFAPGMRIDRERLERRLRRLGYQPTRNRQVAIGQYYRDARGWIIGRRAFRLHDRLDPGGRTRVSVGWGGRVTAIDDARRGRIDFVTLEPELLRSYRGDAMEDRLPVALTDVPQHLVDAVLSIEDQRFFEHRGLDVKRIIGATLANLRAGRFVQGGSTLSQQLVKNLFLTSTRSPIRKLRDMAMAITLERRHTKEEILEAYLNEIYLGQDAGLAIHGVGRAAQYYFGKDVTQLEPHESALIAGIIRGPSLYSPFRNPESARRRRDLVLAVMRERGAISPERHATATAASLGLQNQPKRTRRGRYFIDFVTEQLAANHGRAAVERGLSVLTTLDLDLQQLAEEAVSTNLDRLERDHPRLVSDEGPLQAALVAIDPRTGEILAMVGGRAYGESQFNRAAHARRQPGSAFKPIVALSALSAGSGYTLATVLQDEPLSVETPAGLWQPANYDGEFRGGVSLREALERSLNVPFARLGMEVGPERIVETARRLGVESPLNPVLSLALGSSEVTPLELTRAFGVLAASGYRSDLHATLGVLDAEGDVLSRFEAGGRQVYTQAEAYIVTSALRGVVERGTGRSLRWRGVDGPVAAKSGTTNDFRDAWFIGYTPSLVVGVWVGFDDGRGMGLTGSSAALPIFASFLRGALGPFDREDFVQPSGIETVSVNRETGLRSGYGCPGEREVFLRGTAPRQSCSYWNFRGYTRFGYQRVEPNRSRNHSRRRSRRTNDR
ncbi:MAG: PBP1A family penicillin-binding protein [Gemmatimonadetes bacterium]|nr:PBP1A family penicillin-binding protein [Gemmatimonadota bacterium]